MNTDELKRLAELIKTADHGCYNCVHNMFEEAQSVFPEHREEINDLLKYWLEHESRNY